ncbi:O-antigen ligase family protein [Phaeocystidibacter luteus]|uniref:O-antigen ligase family protein n=1 Tax=Phaeocystidibacter luteus TaxID=911197 RepID=A0A6N6RL90_9FLAO|nr:O-antigen ligase family protein [Phaeocystidibacter luteus]KAB2814031.1 O-antigen ligase family protein [Phaeocystidibacter luteus]
MTKSFRQKVSQWRNDMKLRAISTEIVTAAFVVLLPFQWDFPPISLFIMLLGVVFLFFLNRDYASNLRKSTFFWPILAYYALVAIGLTYSEYPDEGAKDLQVQIALIAWPFGLGCLAALNTEAIHRILWYFVRATALSCILLLGLALSNYLEDGQVRHFFYKHLSAWELVPQHYLSMYISFALLIILNRVINRRSTINKLRLVEILLYGSVFLAMQVLLSVRIQLIALPLALLPVIYSGLRTGLLTKKMKRIGGLSIVALVVAFISLPGTQRRIVETYHEIRSFNRVVEKKQTNHRVYLWKYGTDVISENWLIGTGTGGANEALHIKLQDCQAKFWDGEKVYYLYDKKYNVHNVFLQAWMTHGLAGFILVILILFGPLIRALRQKDQMVAGFLILAIVSFATESMLERQAGVLWFAAFYALLVVNQRREVIPEIKKAP